MPRRPQRGVAVAGCASTRCGKPGMAGEIHTGERQRHQRDTRQQALGRHQPPLESRARGALPDVPGQALAPQWGRTPVPVADRRVQVLASRRGPHRPDHCAGGLQLSLHPLDPNGRVRGCLLQRGGQLGAGDLARRLQPPQGEQVAVRLVQPARRLGGLPALLGQTQPQDRQVDEVRAGIGDVPQLLQAAATGRSPAVPAVADLADGDRHQPRPERRRVAQARDAVDHLQHRLLDHVVHVRVALQGAAGDVVDQGQGCGDQRVECLLITVLRRVDQPRVEEVRHGVSAFEGMNERPYGYGDPAPSPRISLPQQFGELTLQSPDPVSTPGENSVRSAGPAPSRIPRPIRSTT